jgi:tetratricopeptide (TPR) repeat protein
MPEPTDCTESVFAAAAALPADERAAHLDEACAGDPVLRARIEALLRAHDRAGHLLDRPAATCPEVAGACVPAPAVGTVVAGRYKLLQEIGEGGMGTVFVAEQTEPVRRKVALKLIKPGMDSKTVLARFEAERQALALMDHPNIAKVLDGGLTESGRPYFVMEYVKGVPITEYCDAARLSIRERLRLFVPVCQAVQHAHQKEIIHRDLKPSNILIAPYDDRPVPKVIDFGLAKAMHHQLTERTLQTAHETVLGTPLYMSPEQAQLNNLDVDTRSDIYSLGVLLYELLTGVTPLEKQLLEEAPWDEIRRIIREEQPPRPSTRLHAADTLPSLAACRHTEPDGLTRQVRGELDWIVMTALEKDRNRRYETATAFAADVQRYLTGEAVLAVPPSAGYRLKTLARKHRAALATAAAIALLLVAGAAVGTWQAVRATRAEAAARLAQHAEAQRAEGEKQAREQAQKRLAQIERGVELFADLLTGINPKAEEKEGEPLYEQLRQKAERAAVELDGEEVGDPQTVARLQSILGNTLRELGSYETAVAVLQKARATRERELGADHPDTLVTLGNLANAYLEAARLPEAIELYEQVRDARVAKLGADHPSTLTILHNLAAAYRAAGKLPEAIRLYEQVRDGQVAKLGADHPSTLTTLNSLGRAYRAAGRRPEAIQLFEQVRDVQVAKRGADHPDTLATLNNLAGAYEAAGKLPEAIRLHEQVRDVKVAKLGADHPSTLTTLHNLAKAYSSARRWHEAIRLYEQVRDAQVAKRGADHRSTLTTLNNLAVTYWQVNQRPEALRHFEQAAEGIARRKFLDENARGIIDSAARAYEIDRQFDKAETWRRRWLAHLQEKTGPESPAYANELAALGLLLLKQEKWDDAAATLAECLPLRAKLQPDGWSTFNAMSMLGGALLGQKKPAEAEPLLLKGYEGMKQRAAKMPAAWRQVRLSEAVERLVRLYEATGKKDEAAKWRKEQESVKQTAETSAPG